MDNNSFQNFVMQWLESLFNGAVNLIDKIINANGTYEAVNDGADGYKKVVVNVPQPTGTKNISITQNGTTTENVNDYKYAEITASVPNTYAAGDEGKVVSNGALVAQTAHATVTENGTVDTTLNNSVEVAVPVPTLESKSVSANGTYTPESGKAWNEVVVNVPGASYTELSAVSVLQDSTETYDNAVFVICGTSVAKVEVLYKPLTGTIDSNQIVVCGGRPGYAEHNAPYLGYYSNQGVTYITKEIIDGYAHIKASMSFSNGLVRLCGWGDSTFSRSAAYKYFKFYDSSDNLLFNFIPVLDSRNNPCFYETVGKSFYYLGTLRDMVAGEAVI